MSHNHYLECRACGVTNESAAEGAGCNHPGSSYSKFALIHEDVLVENALATKALVRAGLFELGNAGVWASFVADHADCNAFFEVCEHGGECGNAPRRILAEGVPKPACETCLGRRLVACPGCASHDPARARDLKERDDLQAEIRRLSRLRFELDGEIRKDRGPDATRVTAHLRSCDGYSACGGRDTDEPLEDHLGEVTCLDCFRAQLKFLAHKRAEAEGAIGRHDIKVDPGGYDTTPFGPAHPFKPGDRIVFCGKPGVVRVVETLGATTAHPAHRALIALDDQGDRKPSEMERRVTVACDEELVREVPR